MDRRLTPANARAALESLRGQVDAPRFTTGEAASVIRPLVDLRVEPGGPRDRQLLLGDGFLVIDRHEGHAFGQSVKDGHCGYLPEAALGPATTPTHWLAAPASHLYPAPDIRAPQFGALTLGARLTVLAEGPRFSQTTAGYVPTRHLRPLGQWHADPVAIAQVFLGTPYLWGGNSRAGLDCSGLVQASLLACGTPCPSDSDLQQALGAPLADKAVLKRGDLLFWKGHVAMAMNADFMIHATSAFMAVVVENTKAAIARIAAGGDGPVIARRRP
ncbi:NlpC/P60 family protein [Paracoccaceae bacterium Fryx2]|nr:NlpC/P60 family protein [Paracoccaceae bacterium Fryx2]